VDFDASLRAFAERLSAQGGRGRPLAAGSRAAYLKDARLVAGWLADQGVAGPAAVTPSALEAAFRALGWSRGTRARALTALRGWLAPHHPPNRSPADLLDVPRPAPPPVPRLSQREAAAVVEGAGRARAGGEDGLARALALRDRALLELLYGSGLRRQEACDLTLAGLDFEHETVRVVGKGARARTVPLTEPAVAALAAWLREGRPRLVRRAAGTPPREVFLSRTGRPLEGSAVYRVVARALRDAGRGGGPHLLRHAAGTHLLEGPDGAGGAHLRVVQEVLGHRSLATTQRYTGVTTKAMQAALRRGHPRG
jgi:integrase/recombinase XerC